MTCLRHWWGLARPACAVERFPIYMLTRKHRQWGCGARLARATNGTESYDVPCAAAGVPTTDTRRDVRATGPTPYRAAIAYGHGSLSYFCNRCILVCCSRPVLQVARCQADPGRVSVGSGGGRCCWWLPVERDVKVIRFADGVVTKTHMPGGGPAGTAPGSLANAWWL